MTAEIEVVKPPVLLLPKKAPETKAAAPGLEERPAADDFRMARALWVEQVWPGTAFGEARIWTAESWLRRFADVTSAGPPFGASGREVEAWFSSNLHWDLLITAVESGWTTQRLALYLRAGLTVTEACAHEQDIVGNDALLIVLAALR